MTHAQWSGDKELLTMSHAGKSPSAHSYCVSDVTATGLMYECMSWYNVKSTSHTSILHLPSHTNTYHRFHDITKEVLTSVQRTEDSLQKLKRSRRSLAVDTSPAAAGCVMSDDNKIRLQLAYDIDNYLDQVNSHTVRTRVLAVFVCVCVCAGEGAAQWYTRR